MYAGRKRRRSDANYGRYVKRTFRGPAPPRSTTTIIQSQVRRRMSRSRWLKRRNLTTMGFLGIEKKFVDFSLAATAISSAATVNAGMLDPVTLASFTAVSQGDSELQRDGKQISCLYFEIAGTVRSLGVEGTANPPVPASVFLACVLDTQTNAAQMTSDLAFKNQGAAVVGTTSSFRNLLYGKRFRILKQKKFMFNPSITIGDATAASTTASALNYDFRWFIPLNGLKVNFNTTTPTAATIASIVDNSIHLVGFVNNAETQYNISYNARLRFVG